jgi:hypothetical protein
MSAASPPPAYPGAKIDPRLKVPPRADAVNVDNVPVVWACALFSLLGGEKC